MSGKNEDILRFTSAYNAETERQKNTFGQKLRDARRRAGLSQKAVASALAAYHISVQPPAVNKWEHGISLPNPYQVFALCRLLDIEDGVRYFSGPLHPEETALNETGLKKVQDYRSDLAASGKYALEDPIPDTDEMMDARLYDLPVSAGTGMFLDGEEYETISVKKSTVPAGADFALRVRGDSMMPNYRDGQLVWVSACSHLRPGDIGIFIRNDSAYMKMYTEVLPDETGPEDFTDDDGVMHPKIVLESLNPAYDPIPVSFYDTLRIIGRVLN